MPIMEKAGIHLLLIAGLIFTGCKKDEDPPATPAPPVNEEEVFTTVILTFTDTEPVGGIYETFYMEWRDIDGPGGQEPVVSAEAIPAGRYFGVSVTLRNESVTPPVNLTPQIQNEAEEHQFFFDHPGLNIILSNFDLDANGQPLGSTFNAQTVGVSEGTLRVALRHEPDKDAPGVAQGDITNAGGETDIEVDFPVVIF